MMAPWSITLPNIGDWVYWYEADKWPKHKVCGPGQVVVLTQHYAVLWLSKGNLREINHERNFSSREKAEAAAKKVEEQAEVLYEVVSTLQPQHR